MRNPQSDVKETCQRHKECFARISASARIVEKAYLAMWESLAEGVNERQLAQVAMGVRSVKAANGGRASPSYSGKCSQNRALPRSLT